MLEDWFAIEGSSVRRFMHCEIVIFEGQDDRQSAPIHNWDTTLVDIAGLKIVTNRNVTDLYSVHRSIEKSR